MAALDNAELFRFVEGLLWPEAVFVRGTLIGLSELDFRHLLPATAKVIHDWLGGLVQTKVVEDMFKELRKAEKDSDRGVIDERGVYIRCAASALLEGYGRPKPEVTCTVMAQAYRMRMRTLPKSTFKVGPKQATSLGADMMDSLTAPGKRSWPSRAPSGFDDPPIATAPMMATGPGELHSIFRSWLSLLVSSGIVLRKASSEYAFLVFHTCECGCLGWLLKLFKRNGVQWMVSGYAGGRRPRVAISDLACRGSCCMAGGGGRFHVAVGSVRHDWVG